MKAVKSEFNVEGADKNALHCVHWQVEKPKGYILMVHGYAEYIERYEEMASMFNDAGYSVIGYDQRAHGHSEGKDCYINSFQEYIADLNKVITFLAFDKPYFIYAHSMGGLVTTKYLLQKDKIDPLFKGCAFTGALMMVDKDLAPILQKLAPIIAGIAPKMKTTKLPLEGISNVPEEQEKYVSDPLVYSGKVYASTGYQMLKATREMQNNFEAVDFPFLTMHGADDPISDPDSSRNLFKLAASKDKEIKIWDGLVHEIMRSKDKIEVIDTITQWMDKRIEA